MGFAAGRIVGAMLATYAANVDVWMPAPNQWRDMLSIKRGKRDDVNRRVHAFAQSFTGQDVKGPRGGLQLDAANAIGLACAGVVRRSRRHNVD